MRSYTKIAFTPSVQAAQSSHGTRQVAERMASMDFDDSSLSDREAGFIRARDSFYIASVNEAGWPYIQHRGGPVGFLRVVDERTLAFADYQGNRQYITQGNVTVDNRVSLFLMDYSRRRRLKIFARTEVLTPNARPDLTAAVVDPEYRAKVERIIIFRVEAFDWNCPQHITPRWSAAELEQQLEPVFARIAALEAENSALQAELTHFVATCD